MIVDTSALLAVLFGENDAETYAQAISQADVCRISSTTFVEVSIVVESQTGDAGSRQWDSFFRSAAISIEPVTEEHAHTARQAWSDFEKGRHAAGLNFGDCFSYALQSFRRSTLVQRSGFSQNRYFRGIMTSRRGPIRVCQELLRLLAEQPLT